MPGGQVASGRFIELIPEQRLVFTWGWEGEAPPVPPGSTTVVIELERDGAGTLLRLIRKGAPAWGAPFQAGSSVCTT